MINYLALFKYIDANFILNFLHSVDHASDHMSPLASTESPTNIHICNEHIFATFIFIDCFDHKLVYIICLANVNIYVTF